MSRSKHGRIERPSFRNLPSVTPFVPSRALLEEPRVCRGCVHCTSPILYAPPTRPTLRQLTLPPPPLVHLILALFVLRGPPRVSWPSSSSNSCSVYTLVRLRTPSCICTSTMGETSFRDWRGDARRTGRKEVHGFSRTKGATVCAKGVEGCF